MEENRFMKQAREELEYLSGDPDFQDIVKDRARFLRDQFIMKDAAKEEGAKEKQLEIAKNMIKEKIDIKIISKVTGLSIDEIKNM